MASDLLRKKILGSVQVPVPPKQVLEEVQKPVLVPEPVQVPVPNVQKSKTEDQKNYHRSDILKGVEEVAKWTRTESRTLLKSKLSDDTVLRYERDVRRLEELRPKVGEPIDLSSHAHASNTFYKYRAAVKFVAAKEALEALDAFERARDKYKKEPSDPSHKTEMDKQYQIILQSAATLKHYESSALQNSKLVKLGLADPVKPSVPKALKDAGVDYIKRDNSKLKDTNKIVKKYPNWRGLVFQRLQEIKSGWLDHVATLALSGCRPEELSSVRVMAKDSELVIHIQGAKVSKTKGQPTRIIKVRDDGSPEFKHLFTSANSRPGVAVKLSPSTPGAVTKTLERAGKQVLPKAPNLSSYVYRHSFASDLKCDGFDKTEIAQALGHAATRTQGAYGQALGGVSGARKVSIYASREVRQTHSTRYSSQNAPSTPTSGAGDALDDGYTPEISSPSESVSDHPFYIQTPGFDMT